MEGISIKLPKPAGRKGATQATQSGRGNGGESWIGEILVEALDVPTRKLLTRTRRCLSSLTVHVSFIERFKWRSERVTGSRNTYHGHGQPPTILHHVVELEQGWF